MSEMSLETTRGVSTRGILAREEAVSTAFGVIRPSFCHIKDLALDCQINILFWIRSVVLGQFLLCQHYLLWLASLHKGEQEMLGRRKSHTGDTE